MPLTDNQYRGHSEGCTAIHLVQFVAAMTLSALLQHSACFHTPRLQLLKHVVSSIRLPFSSFPMLTFGHELAIVRSAVKRCAKQIDEVYLVRSAVKASWWRESEAVRMTKGGCNSINQHCTRHTDTFVAKSLVIRFLLFVPLAEPKTSLCYFCFFNLLFRYYTFLCFFLNSLTFNWSS